MKFCAVIVALILVSPLWAQNNSQNQLNNAETLAIDGTTALMRGLDTITGATSNFTVVVGKDTKFGRLTVEVSSCRFLPENPSSNSYAYVTVTEHQAQVPLFSAWMVASAPALSAMEHPRYDIWLIRCNAATDSPSNG